jgi:hypothetical protein
MTGIAACCALTASGHVAATPPRSVFGKMVKLQEAENR